MVLDKKKQIKKDTFRAILESFMKRIRVSVEAGNTMVVLEMPVFIAGYPAFDRDKGLEYLKRQLVLLGYHVHSLSSYMMHVSWSRAAKQEVAMAPPLANIHHLADEIRRKNHR